MAYRGCTNQGAKLAEIILKLILTKIDKDKDCNLVYRHKAKSLF